MSTHDNKDLIDYEDKHNIVLDSSSAPATNGTKKRTKKNFSGIHSTRFRFWTGVLVMLVAVPVRSGDPRCLNTNESVQLRCMPSLQEVVSRLSRFPELASAINLEQLQSFISLVSRCLPAIRSDPVNKSCRTLVELTLPADTVKFLVGHLKLPSSTILLCWVGFGDLAGEPITLLSNDDALSRMGPAFGIVADTLEPPKICTTETCRGVQLTKRQEYRAALFTLHRGIVPITVASMYCQHCHMTYHHNYKVHNASNPNAQRVYYPGIPDRLMVSMHFIVESQLVGLWEPQMVFSHTSAEAAARIYNAGLRTHADTELLPSTIWDSFFLHALLRDATKRQFQLCIPHNGSKADRLNTALKIRNERMVGTGQDHLYYPSMNYNKYQGGPKSTKDQEETVQAFLRLDGSRRKPD
ncbi:hypothetical protein C8R44DRAFT_941086 [Mycena epipterygia]|nr:hypothetical protein C8R44DRAFT_941086 [Mycena epipterygia]